MIELTVSIRANMRTYHVFLSKLKQMSTHLCKYLLLKYKEPFRKICI